MVWALPREKTQGLTVDKLARKLQSLYPGKYKDGFDFTWIADNVVLAGTYGVATQSFSRLSLEQLTIVTNRAPALVTVDYTLLPRANQYDPYYRNQHAICIKRIVGGMIHYGDPYGRDSTKYGNMTMTVAQFMAAWNSTRFQEVPRQGIRLLI